MTNFSKDPSEKLDYTLDWDDRLAVGETISASTWSVPAGITQSTPSPSFTTTTTTIWLTGGTAGTNYQVTNHVTTSAGREYERSIFIFATDL